MTMQKILFLSFFGCVYAAIFLWGKRSMKSLVSDWAAGQGYEVIEFSEPLVAGLSGYPGKPILTKGSHVFKVSLRNSQGQKVQGWLAVRRPVWDGETTYEFTETA